MEEPQISVVVVAYNSANVISKCIESLWSQTLKPHEIIVVDNASTDGTMETLKRMNITVIQNPQNLGFAKANNIGIKNSTGDFIATLNPDAWADERWLEMLYNRMEFGLGTGVVGSKILDSNGKIWSAGGKLSIFRPGMAFLIGNNEPDDGYHDKVCGRDFVDTCACLIRKSMMDKIGMFDEKFWLNVDDLDFCFRAHSGGYKIFYEPTAVAHHDAGHSIGRGKEYYYDNIKGQTYFIRKHFRGVRGFIAKTSYGIYLMFLKFKFRKEREIWEAICRAVADAKNL